MHTVFKIKPNCGLKCTALTASVLNTLIEDIGTVEVVIIDEVSTIGGDMFKCINQRLKEVKDSSKSLGGRSSSVLGTYFDRNQYLIVVSSKIPIQIC